ncbi:MAG: lipocalin family protein [Planctomycetes bacterium]|nr:lipocalin family protein [Planctomycetota bacterium]
MNRVLMAAFVAMLGAGCSAYDAFYPPLATVDNVDVSRYVGKWYEIAKYPNPFQKQCVGGTTAEYAVLDDGRVQVINRCQTADGTVDSIEGRARIVDTSTNAKLAVGFFGPFEGAYWILEVGPNYEYAVVGEPSRSTLWILSRTSTMNDATYQGILSRLPDRGYDPSKLVVTPQP